MNLLKTERVYRWFSSPGMSEDTYARGERIDNTLIRKIIGTVRLTDEDKKSPSYTTVLIDRDKQLKELEKSVASPKELERSSQVLVFASSGHSQEAVNETMAALGTAMVTAALSGIDSYCIEDFDTAKIDELLGLEEEGFHSIALLPLH